ncbi:MAG: mechanosensitive ion channel [Woeseiaceae bacterium]
MEEKFRELTLILGNAGTTLLSYFSQPAVIFQFLILAALLTIAFLISWRVEPRIKARVEKLRLMAGVRRVLDAMIERTEWVFFVALCVIALFVSRKIGWPADDKILSNALLLALAWFVINVGSHTINKQGIRTLLSVSIWTYVALSLLGVFDDVVGFLDDKKFPIGKGDGVSVLDMVGGIVVLGVMLWVAVVVGNFLDQRIREIQELTPSLRVLVGKILRILLVVVAGFSGLSLVGIDLTVFTVLSGAIGVGIGFGLQKVVSNFISGIIILADRSIKPGDTISLGETFGWIRELRARFVSVVTRDGREYLIPNEDFITQQVINWSFSDDLVRLDVKFGVSYDSDPHVVTNLAVEATTSVSRIVQSQTPVCWMTGFGDSSLDFLLRFWIRDPQNGLTNIRGQVLLALWDIFKDNGIKIPYPHLEIIMKDQPAAAD